MLLPKRVKYRKQFRGRMSGTVTRFPNRDEIDVPVDEQAIVE